MEEELECGGGDGEDGCTGYSIEDESGVCRATRGRAEGKCVVEHCGRGQD